MSNNTPQTGAHSSMRDAEHIFSDDAEGYDICEEDTAITPHKTVTKIILNEDKQEELIRIFDANLKILLHPQKDNLEAIYRRFVIKSLFEERVIYKERIQHILLERKESDHVSEFDPQILTNVFEEIHRLNQYIAVHEDNL